MRKGEEEQGLNGDEDEDEWDGVEGIIAERVDFGRLDSEEGEDEDSDDERSTHAEYQKLE